MSCSPSPTATEYATLTSYSPSTSYSQSGASPQVTTVVQQSCVASTTINGSSVSCLSSTQITQVNTVGGGQGAQVPVVVTVPVVQTQPTQTLFAPCTDDGSSPASQSSAPSSTYTPLTTSILVQSTFPPSTITEATSATLADGSVVQTVVTLVTTQPPTSVYLATSVDPSSTPALQSNNDASQGSGTDVAPIVGGVLGGFLGLIAIVGSLWWLCRRRRSWDDIFDKDELHNEEAWQPPSRRGHDRLGSNAEPKPYQYGLVGRVIPPAAAGEPVRSSQYGSISEHSGTHSRNTSYSATPLLQGTRSSRPSTAGSALTIQTNSGPRVRSPGSAAETVPRSLSMVSNSNSRPLLDGQPASGPLGDWTPNTDDLTVLEPLDRSGSPVPSDERRILQIVNDGPPSPTDTASQHAARRASSVHSSNVIIHTDGGRVPESDPPAYSR